MTTITPQSQLDADAAYALRLQRELVLDLDDSTPSEPNAPLVSDTPSNPRRRRAGVEFRANLWQDFNSSWSATWIVVIFNLPQILAALIVIPLNWESSHVCDSVHRLKWKVWALVNTIRLFFHLVIAVLTAISSRRHGRDSPVMRRLYHARNAIDMVSFIWFLLGNMWLFDDDDSGCPHPSRSPMYLLSLSMLIITYIHLCLPCILGILMVPILCFCLPCLVRWLNIVRERQAGRDGASDQLIQKLPCVTLDTLKMQAEPGEEIDDTCPICLGTFEDDTNVRLLPCHHYFHPECVDEWLRLKANCPTCRHSIDPASSNPEEAGDDNEDQDIEMGAVLSDESTGLVSASA